MAKYDEAPKAVREDAAKRIREFLMSACKRKPCSLSRQHP